MTERDDMTLDDCDEDRIYEILAANPFYDDRVDILVNCIILELEDEGLGEADFACLRRELHGVIDKYELKVPAKEGAN